MWHRQRSHICTQGLGFSTDSQFSVDNKGLIISLNRKSYPGHHFKAMYCIVNRFNSRVQFLRTKQRVLGSAGMLAAVAEPLVSPDTSIKCLLTQRLLCSGLFTLVVSPPIHTFDAQPLANNIFIYFLSLIKSSKLPQTSPHHFLPKHRYK